MSDYYPLFLKVRGKRCVVVGGGRVALRKVRALLEHGASIELISPSLCPELNQLAQAEKINIIHRNYEPGDLNSAFLVIAGTGDNEINYQVAVEARKRRIPVNVVDNPEQSDFIVPSYLRRGDLTIAVSTDGSSPALARKIRARLEKYFSEEYASLTNLVKEVRTELKAGGVTVSAEDWQRAINLDQLIGLLRANQQEKAKTTLLSSLKAANPENNEVQLRNAALRNRR
jgi:siroheme synthase-like protein